MCVSLYSICCRLQHINKLILSLTFQENSYNICFIVQLVGRILEQLCKWNYDHAATEDRWQARALIFHSSIMHLLQRRRTIITFLSFSITVSFNKSEISLVRIAHSQRTAATLSLDKSALPPSSSPVALYPKTNNSHPIARYPQHMIPENAQKVTCKTIYRKLVLEFLDVVPR